MKRKASTRMPTYPVGDYMRIAVAVGLQGKRFEVEQETENAAIVERHRFHRWRLSMIEDATVGKHLPKILVRVEGKKLIFESRTETEAVRRLRAALDAQLGEVVSPQPKVEEPPSEHKVGEHKSEQLDVLKELGFFQAGAGAGAEDGSSSSN